VHGPQHVARPRKSMNNACAAAKVVGTNGRAKCWRCDVAPLRQCVITL
jgi:hypothetical protein